jgi:hypothetical protein
MKISKASWIVLLVGIFLIMSASIGWIYYQQLQQENNIEAEIAAAKQALAGINFDNLNEQKTAINSEISEVNKALDDIQQDLNSEIYSISITDIILSEAEGQDIAVKEMSSSGQTTGLLGGIPFNSINIVMSVEGTLTDIKTFVERLNEKFPNSITEYVQMDSKPEQLESEEDPEDNPNPIPELETGAMDLMKGKISLTIYSYEGD